MTIVAQGGKPLINDLNQVTWQKEFLHILVTDASDGFHNG